MSIRFYVIRIFQNFAAKIFGVLVTSALLLVTPVAILGAVATFSTGSDSSFAAIVTPGLHATKAREPDTNTSPQAMPSTVWPVCGYISAPFGVPHHPWQDRHTGVDIANPLGKTGDPVTTFMEGTVTDIKPVDRGGLGKYVIVEHTNELTSLYGHLSKITATRGQKVSPGDTIGLEGNSGLSTGSHVHFEVRVEDVPVDPASFMVGRPKTC